MIEVCTKCEEQCHGEWKDFGVGLTEAWGVVQNHHDWAYVSDCCEHGVEQWEEEDWEYHKEIGED